MEASDGALLAVAVRDGVVELARTAVLRGSARRLFESLDGGELSEVEVQALLLREGGVTEEQARSDARRFVDEVVAHDLARPSDGATPAPAGGGPLRELPRAEPAARAACTDPLDLVRLTRKALASGHRVRFQAFGRSMRPLVPHGSRLEVEPGPFEGVRRGDVVLHTTRDAQLVAHRVVAREGDALVTRGDSNAQRELVGPDTFLGVVVGREIRGRRLALTGASSRWFGLVSGAVYAALVAVARTLLLRPLRATFGGPSLVRRSLRFVLRVASGLLFRLERAAKRVRHPFDVLRSALLSTAEKDADRTRLYARRAIQRFTSLDENLEAGLTLLEEVLLARHPLPPGKVLVLGCGPGRECLALARRGHEVTGIDREEGMLARARELAEAASLDIRYLPGEVVDLDVDGGPFDAVVIFSGLYNMVLPRARRVSMLAASRRHLRPGGVVLVTFLSDYLWPGEGPPPGGKHLLESLNPEHERGDFYLLNEAVHVFPRAENLASEAREAGFEVVDLHRDQRAYDRAEGMVRGYAVLRRPLTAASGPERKSTGR